MPRLTQTRPRYNRLRVLLQGTVAATGKTTAQVAAIWGCSIPTALKRMRDPGSITVDQLLTLCAGLGIPIEEARNAISRA